MPDLGTSEQVGEAMACQARRWLECLDDDQRARAETALPGGAVLRPCAALEDLGRELVRSLDHGQFAAAWLAPQAPPDIVTGNRPALKEGLWVTPPPELFRDAAQVPAPLLDGLQARLAADERALGPAAIQALRWSATPAGVSWQQLRPDQRQMLTALLGAYLGRLPDDAAQREHAKITGAAAGQLHFAWAGRTEPRRPHYYRLQGPRLLVEYDKQPAGRQPCAHRVARPGRRLRS